jgi:tRNA-dihydrouridine synthase 3
VLPSDRRRNLVVVRCRFTHDISAYLAAKPRDILFPSASSLTEFPPFVQARHDSSSNDAATSTIDFDTVCPVFEETGHCRHGLKCRFLGGHAQRGDDGEIVLVVDTEKEARAAISTTELNFVDADTLKLLRSRKVGSHGCCGVYSYTILVSSPYFRSLLARITSNRWKR